MSGKKYSEGLKAAYEEEDQDYIKRPDRVRFIDSHQFLAAGLDKLVENVKKGGLDSFPIVKKVFAQLCPQLGRDTPTDYELDLLTSKQKYPYTFMDSRDIFKPNTPIPGREKFKNDLTGEELTDDEWEHVQKVIETFKLKDFKDYARFYALTDVILLSQVWTNFSDTGMKSFGLDPTYCVSASGYSSECCYYFTKAEVGCIKDMLMLRLIQDGVRGGPCYTTQRLTRAFCESFGHVVIDPKTRQRILYVDLNSLYATILCGPLPTDNLEWVALDILKSIDWKNFESKDTGYLIRCSLEYPREIHKYTEDVPLAPELAIIKNEDLSEEQIALIDKLSDRVKTNVETKRLLLTCTDKQNYVLHSSALKYYLNMGMKLVDIKEGIKYRETEVFKKYIMKNLELRAAAKNEFEVGFFKLLSNAIFGKCLQSPLDRIQVKVCLSRAEAEEYIADPNFKDWKRLNDDVSLFYFRENSVTFNSPIFIGQAILDLAKVHYYKAYYDDLKNIFGPRVRVHYVDTDSAVLCIQDPENSFFSDLLTNSDVFDFSKIPSDHEIFRDMENVEEFKKKNKGKQGIWKIETLDILEMVALKAKQYSLLMYGGKEELKTKGVNLKYAKDEVTHARYTDVAVNQSLIDVEINQIRSFNHKIFTIVSNRVGFHGIDLKRFYIPGDNLNRSLPYGYNPK